MTTTTDDLVNEMDPRPERTCSLCFGRGVKKQGQGLFMVQVTCPRCLGTCKDPVLPQDEDK